MCILTPCVALAAVSHPTAAEHLHDGLQARACHTQKHTQTISPMTLIQPKTLTGSSEAS